MKIYGIKNCNTVKKALVWLDDNGIDYTFVDFKKEPANEKLIAHWLQSKSWKELVNTKGTTYRMLSDEEKKKITNESSAIHLMVEKNSVIKRPVLELNNTIVLGFDEAVYRELFKK